MPHEAFTNSWRSEGNILVKTLVRLLKEAYRKYLLLTPLPWEEISIPIADLYTECWCELLDKRVSGTQVIKDRKIRKCKRVVLMAEHGYGRTTFTKYLVHQWIQDNVTSCLLIYIPLREVTRKMYLSDVVKKDLPEDISLDTKDIKKVLTCKAIRTVVILDGLEDLSKSCNESMTSENSGDNKVTIDELLNGTVKSQYTNFHVWITSREADFKSSALTQRHYTTVKVLGQSNLFPYIKKCCDFYSRERNPTDCQAEGEETFCLLNNDSSASRDNDLHDLHESVGTEPSSLSYESKKVVNFLIKNDVLNDFKTTPLLLNIMIHVLAIVYTSGTYKSLIMECLKEKEIKNLTTLMTIVLDCMKRRYLRKKQLSHKDFVALEQAIGKVAFQDSGPLMGKKWEIWKSEIGEEHLNTSLDIGFLKFSQDSSAGSTALATWARLSSNIEFYHQHIRDFLVARYVVDNNDTNSESLLDGLLKDTHESNERVLIYISGLMDEDGFQQLCEALKEHQKYVSLIDCFHENGNYDILPNVLKSDRGQIPVDNLKSNFHWKAVQAFFKHCKQSEIELYSVSFKDNTFLKLMKYLSLPSIGDVEFCQSLSQTDRERIEEWLKRHKVTCKPRFEGCTLSKTAKEATETIEDPPGQEADNQEEPIEAHLNSIDRGPSTGTEIN